MNVYLHLVDTAAKDLRGRPRERRRRGLDGMLHHRAGRTERAHHDRVRCRFARVPDQLIRSLGVRKENATVHFELDEEDFVRAIGIHLGGQLDPAGNHILAHGRRQLDAKVTQRADRGLVMLSGQR